LGFGYVIPIGVGCFFLFELRENEKYTVRIWPHALFSYALHNHLTTTISTYFQLDFCSRCC